MKKPEGCESFRSVSELARFVGVTSRTIERWYASEVIPTPAQVTDTGMKLWSPEQAQTVLDFRMSKLPTERMRRRRIT